MNRQTKRMMQRQGQIGADGTPLPREAPPTAGRRGGGRPRTSPAEFLRGVRTELRNVAWPDRATVANYSVVVFVTVVLLLFGIFGLNWAFGHAVTWLLDV